MPILLSSQTHFEPTRIKVNTEKCVCVCVYNVQLSLFMGQTFLNGVKFLAAS